MIRKRDSKPHKKKIRTMALSIFLAIIVWFMVMSLTNPTITTTISNLDVRFVGETALREKQLAVTGRNNTPPLSVTVKGSREDLMNFTDKIYVQVDLGDINEVGDYNMSGMISMPTTRITVEKENYGDIPIKVEAVESKEIEVGVKQTGTLKNKLVQSVVNNPKVTITGAKSEMDKVHGAVATFDISSIKEDGVSRVGYLLTDETGALIEDNETLESARGDVEISNTIYEAKTLPIEPALTADLQRDYILKKDKVTLSPTTALVGVNGENTSEAVIARIDKVSGNEEEYTLESAHGMYIPPETRKVKIKAELAKKVTKQIELNVEAINVASGLTARIDGGVTAMVWGEEEQVSGDNIHAVTDAAGLGKGTYTLPVRLEGDYVGLEGEYTVNVTIE